jgi:hypothetical protein
MYPATTPAAFTGLTAGACRGGTRHGAPSGAGRGAAAGEHATAPGSARDIELEASIASERCEQRQAAHPSHVRDGGASGEAHGQRSSAMRRISATAKPRG